MNLGFFTMPIHPLDKDWRQSLREDREAFILADELGYTEGYVGEHHTDRAENITSCMMFICTLIEATRRIKLGTGTVNMPNNHPAAVAANAAMLDHMLDGRFILGISPGGLLSDAEVFGNLDADRNAMFLECINQVLEIWASDAPYNIKGKYWNIVLEKQLMLDHMLDGRLIFGISPGGLLSDAELFGNLDADRNAMFLESINQVLQIWAGEPPYNLAGKYWNISTQKTLIRDIGQGIIARPLQRPHPPIVVTAVAPFSKGVTEAAARGWEPISANFLMPQWVKSHWPKYVEGCQRVGRPALPANWRVAKSIFVADDDKVARDYATGPNSPYRYYYQQLFTKLARGGRYELFKTHREQPDSEVTLDGICKELIIYGTPNKVADELLAFREKTGDFGTLLYAGKDWTDVALGRRSMVLMAEKVMPKVNAAIGARQAAE